MNALVLALSLTLATTPAKPPAPADLATPPAADANGLATRVLAQGSGSDKPTETDTVKIRYTVWRSDGTVVDHIPSTRAAILEVSKMLPGWRMAVVQMVEGERRRAWIPDSLGAGKIAAGTSFVIDTELIDILRAPATPEDVAAPPADAIRTKSGLAYKILRQGSGTTRPRRSSTVVVHYTGWTTDGRMFDSSVARGEPAEFPLDAVIRGWTEGLQLLTEGSVARFWIPANLAYGRERGKPQGMLVFDVELVDVK